MKHLDSQEQFEALWFQKDDETLLEGMRSSDKGWIVYFTASWCGPCQRLDVAKLDAEATKKGLTLWKCDVSKNEYTPGYCGIRSIPTFVFFRPSSMGTPFSSSDTSDVQAWMLSLP